MSKNSYRAVRKARAKAAEVLPEAPKPKAKPKPKKTTRKPKAKKAE